MAESGVGSDPRRPTVSVVSFLDTGRKSQLLQFESGGEALASVRKPVLEITCDQLGKRVE